ncbi:DUF1904 domain-containing protein [Bdellovibrio svalbardensis]|uniref:DUF1904 domain-containing protein n=1 Tax=Bdellovibrio svalbardensis TaxID=2972972 RepID=A0ABT6DGP2_9BACT|nr:DUF1904 domain-containing protein [Bdellovibrio svalbardensis]MDG0815983.1 DUF1904 domain-containing protein [Bdellovibrio svalbardensis]
MPHIRMRAMTEEHVAKLSGVLAKELAVAVHTDIDNFTFELVETKFFTQGKATKSYPFVEVLWFPRSQESKNACARIITDHIKELVGKEEDVVVLFKELAKESYYENGKHF